MLLWRLLLAVLAAEARRVQVQEAEASEVRVQLLPARSPRVPPRVRVRAEAPRPANSSFDVQWADVPDGTSPGRRVPPALQLNRRAVTAAALSTALLPLSAGAAEFIVDPVKAADAPQDPLAESGSAYSTISAAVAAAPSGAAIIVRPGMYNERVKITKSLSIRAELGTQLVWETEKPYEAALTIDLSEATEAADVLVSGIAIRHYSKSIAQNYACFIPQPSKASDADTRIELRNCDISSRSGSGIGVEGGYVTVEGCRVHDCKNHGVSFLGPSSRGVVRRSSIEANKLNGILLRDGAAPRVEANRINANSQYGASLIDCRGTYLDNNDAGGNGKGAVSGECDVDD